MTVTLDLPEPFARQLLAKSEPERSRYIIGLMDNAVAPAGEDDVGDVDRFAFLNPADLAPGEVEAIEKGLAASDAGRVVPASDVFARLDALVGVSRG